jgi:hypothetical protein
MKMKCWDELVTLCIRSPHPKASHNTTKYNYPSEKRKTRKHRKIIKDREKTTFYIKMH